LIVIDFIDMEVHRNNAQVERRLKDCMADDRARIQIGRISHFGLLELSRQRLRPSLMETNFEACIHCGGTGVVRSVESTSLTVLRSIEEEASQHRAGSMTVRAPAPVALYLLNQKRGALQSIEERHGLRIAVVNDDSLIHPDFNIETDKSTGGDAADKSERREKTPAPDHKTEHKADRAEHRTEHKERDEETAEGEGGRKRRRRPRRRRKSAAEHDAEHDAEQAHAETAADEEAAATEAAEAVGAEHGMAEAVSEDAEAGGENTEGKDGAAKPRRRGRRGGRRRSRRSREQTENAAAEGTEMQENGQSGETAADMPQDRITEPAEEEAAPAAATETETQAKMKTETEAESPEPQPERHDDPVESKPEPKPEPEPAPEPIARESHTTVIDVGATKPADDAGSQRRGWWQR
ncbi:MAG: ribonuclease E/G, partial [Rhodospirillales bacterium]